MLCIMHSTAAVPRHEAVPCDVTRNDVICEFMLLRRRNSGKIFMSRVIYILTVYYDMFMRSNTPMHISRLSQ